MMIKYNTEQLTNIVSDIFSLTGISISILDSDYKLIATSKCKQEYCLLLQTMDAEKKRCGQCDSKLLNRCHHTKKVEFHICRTGLYDAAMPIIKDNIVVGFIIMGQVRSVKSPTLPHYLPDTDPQTLKRLNEFYKKIPFISKKHLDAVYDLLPRILFDNAIKIVYDPFVSEVVTFIDANLQDNLCIKLLCEKFYISKNRLYDAFQKNLGCTVTSYINERRIRTAKKLLEQSDDSVRQIAEAVGIYNYTYFYKLFKKLTGVTPTEYRKCPPI